GFGVHQVLGVAPVGALLEQSDAVVVRALAVVGVVVGVGDGGGGQVVQLGLLHRGGDGDDLGAFAQAHLVGGVDDVLGVVHLGLVQPGDRGRLRGGHGDRGRCGGGVGGGGVGGRGGVAEGQGEAGDGGGEGAGGLLGGECARHVLLLLLP